MRRDDFLHAFELLGSRLPDPVHVIVAGGSALILAGYIDRDTGDGDLIETSPKLSTFERYIREVGEELLLPEHWLNDGARAWHDLLPPDFHTRITSVRTFGNLTVDRLSRQDLILMKLAAGRPRDLDDVAVLAPTPQEIAFVQSQLERINSFNPGHAMRIQLYLEQGAGPDASDAPAVTLPQTKRRRRR
jgi:hypothetical protein